LEAKDQELLKKRAGSEHRLLHGEFVVVQWRPPRTPHQKGRGGRFVRTHLDLEGFAREQAVLADHERLEPAMTAPNSRRRKTL
jgi:hypothetical protein